MPFKNSFSIFFKCSFMHFISVKNVEVWQLICQRRTQHNIFIPHHSPSFGKPSKITCSQKLFKNDPFMFALCTSSPYTPILSYKESSPFDVGDPFRKQKNNEYCIEYILLEFHNKRRWSGRLDTSDMSIVNFHLRSQRKNCRYENV